MGKKWLITKIWGTIEDVSFMKAFYGERREAHLSLLKGNRESQICIILLLSL